MTFNKYNFVNCTKCLYYIKIKSHNNVDLSMCRKFKRESYNYYKTKYEYAEFCRDDELKCGFNGKYYIEKNSKFLK